MEAADLEALEEKLWRAESRFDSAWMNLVLAPDFFEYGRSGRQYSRQETLDAAFAPFTARLPLREYRVRVLAPDLVQSTYVSEVVYEGVTERARRSSIWSCVDGTWQLRFHQGTAIE